LLRRAPTLKLQRKRKRLREGEDGNPDSYRDRAVPSLHRDSIPAKVPGLVPGAASGNTH